jgi:hypothetical protein
MCSKSNPIVVFALDLMSTYEGEHTIFGLLGQANFEHMIKALAHKGGVRIGKTPKKLANICCP